MPWAPLMSGGGARAVGGRHGVLDHPTRLFVPLGPEQGVGIERQGLGVLATVGLDRGELHGSLDLGEGRVPSLAEVDRELRQQRRESARPERVAFGRRRGRVPRGAVGSRRCTRPTHSQASPARSSSRARPTVSVASAPTSHRSAARASRSAASRGAPSFSARSAPWRSAANAAEPSPARLVVRREVAESAQLVDPVGRDRLEVGGPGRVHRRRLAGQVGLGQDVGQQRVPEPDAVTAEHDHPGVDGLADRPGLGDAELRGDGRQRPQVGRAAGDGEDPGDLPRWGRHPAPGVQQRLAELVGQVVGQLGGVEVAAAYQQLAEVRVAPRPLVHLLHQPRRRWPAEQLRRSGRRWRPGRGGSAPAPRCRAAGGRCPASAGSAH